MAIILNTYSPFSVPIFEWTDVLSKNENKQLEKFALKLEKNEKSEHKSNEGGFQSEGKTPEIDIELKPLYDKIQHCFNEVASQMQYKKDIQVDLSRGWFNVNRKNSYNQLHTHPGCNFACCYYINVPKNSGKIIFKNPIQAETHMNHFEYKSYHSFNSIDYNIKPETSKFLMWPAYMEHSVETNKTDKPRISFSLNIKIYDI
jgi:uncharacterized protein (TIGR02466 family)|tara:strand:- start:340 stop:945 length:606 start_codon:yes stop_codon:yes gene_type:complete